MLDMLQFLLYIYLKFKFDWFQFEEDKGTMMQKLSVQMLCYQLDTTWQFFTRTFKMQVEPF